MTSQPQVFPVVRVNINGAPLDPAASRALTAMRIQQRLSQPTLCELTWPGPPPGLALTDELQPGAALQVIAGDGAILFRGAITAVEHVYNDPLYDHMVYVRAYDALHRLRQNVRSRVHIDVTLAGLARELLADTAIEVVAHADELRWPYLVQNAQSDLALLVELAERCGLYLTLEEGQLRFVTLAGWGEPLVLRRGATLRSLSVTLNAERACPSVTARGWDAGGAAIYEARVESARHAGAALPAGWADLGDEREIANARALNESHARALAQAALDRRAGAAAVLAAVAEGDPQLRPGAVVQLEGVDAPLTGRYALTAVTHLLDAREGYRAELDTRPPEPALCRTGATIAPAVVTQVDDPEAMGRVRVRLPTFGDVETDWAPVVTQAAGPTRGLVALPDIGDRVLLLLAEGDPGQALVLGGLYSPDTRPHDSGLAGGRVRRFSFRTGGGQLIALDVEGSQVRIENGAGSTLELSPERLSVSAASDLVLEAPGHTITLRGQRIDFERG